LFKNKRKWKIFLKIIWTNYVDTYFSDSSSDGKAINHQNMGYKNNRGYTFMGTHDGQEEKIKNKLI
jgi:hypothetical protein